MRSVDSCGMPLSVDDYEDAYAEALLCLADVVPRLLAWTRQNEL